MHITFSDSHLQNKMWWSTESNFLLSVVLLCGLDGFSDFYNLDWLEQILLWQDPEDGCFGKECKCISTLCTVITFKRYLHPLRQPQSLMAQDHTAKPYGSCVYCLCSVCFPSWLLIHFPGRTYSTTTSQKGQEEREDTQRYAVAQLFKPVNSSALISPDPARNLH